MDALKSLTIDYWYKALMALSAMILLAALTVPMQMDNRCVATVALGAFLFGMGEWMNHPLRTQLRPGIKITSHPRSAKVGGMIFDVLGLALVAFGVYRLVV